MRLCDFLVYFAAYFGEYSACKGHKVSVASNTIDSKFINKEQIQD